MKFMGFGKKYQTFKKISNTPINSFVRFFKKEMFASNRKMANTYSPTAFPSLPRSGIICKISI
jgi:hypothetical protein